MASPTCAARQAGIWSKANFSANDLAATLGLDWGRRRSRISARPPGRLRLRGPKSARDEFLLAATAQNLRKLAKPRAMPAIANAAA